MNYYEILKVSKRATKQEIKKAYKLQVKKYHPDLYVGDKDFAEKKIKEINEAYDILSDAAAKAEYDAFLQEQAAPAHTPPASPHASPRAARAKEPPPEEPSFAKFVLDKLNAMQNKRRTQVILLIVFAILALFLLNLIQIHQYLSSLSEDAGISEPYEGFYDSADDDDDDEIDYSDYDFEDYVYEMLEKYYEEHSEVDE